MELVKITLVGQSFMLHQIRKMVSLVVFIVRFSSNENVIHFAFGQHPVNIPLAPGEFLCLENVTRFDALLITDFHKCNFEGYNKKLKTGNSPSPPIDMSTIQVSLLKMIKVTHKSFQGRTEFKEKHIYPAVIELERKEQLYPFEYIRINVACTLTFVKNEEVSFKVGFLEASSKPAVG
jgi:tRNA pseudouridine38-40 synthase